MCAEMLLRVYLGQIFSVPHDRNGSCVTSITGPNGGAELYER